MDINVPAVPPNTEFSLKAKHPFNTWTLVISHICDQPPKHLIDKLLDEGFQEKAPFHPYKDRVEKFFSKPGSGLFNGWTEKERIDNLSKIGVILKDFNIESCPQIFLTPTDLL